MTSGRLAGETPTIIQKGAPSAEELRPTSGRAGATLGASRASRTPECGTLCCRLRALDSDFCWYFKVRSGRARL